MWNKVLKSREKIISIDVKANCKTKRNKKTGGYIL